MSAPAWKCLLHLQKLQKRTTTYECFCDTQPFFKLSISRVTHLLMRVLIAIPKPRVLEDVSDLPAHLNTTFFCLRIFIDFCNPIASANANANLPGYEFEGDRVSAILEGSAYRKRANQ